MPASFDLDETYLVLDYPSATEVAGGPQFWETVHERTDLGTGYLMMVGSMDKTWDSWEMHPAGEEIVYLLSGSVDFVLDLPGGNQTVELRGRAGCTVPRGTWHRAIVHEPGDMLFVTPGAGTKHRPFGE